MKRYLAQRRRGSDGFGFYIPESNRLTHNPREGRILSLLRRTKASEILFHHRFPTSTGNVRTGCHPYSTKDYFEHQYIVVHNGVLSNSYALRDAHYKAGIKYVSEQEDGRFNDSEALTYDLARYFEGQVEYLTAAGSIAFIAIKLKAGKPVAVLFGRNYGNPLKMQRTKKNLTLSSEGAGTDVEAHQLHVFDYKTQTVTRTPMQIPHSIYNDAYYRGRYEHHAPVDFDDDRDFGWDPHQRPSTNYKADANYGSVPTALLTSGSSSQKGANLEDIEDVEFKRAYSKVLGQVRDALMEAGGGDVFVAVEEGESQLIAMDQREKYLEDRERLDVMTDDELGEYLEITEQITFLQKVVQELKEECLESQIGFRHQEQDRTKLPEGVQNVLDAVITESLEGGAA